MLRAYRYLFYRLYLLFQGARRNDPKDLAWTVLSAIEIVSAVAIVILTEPLFGVRIVEFASLPEWAALVFAGLVLGLNYLLLARQPVFDSILREFSSVSTTSR